MPIARRIEIQHGMTQSGTTKEKMTQPGTSRSTGNQKVRGPTQEIPATGASSFKNQVNTSPTGVHMLTRDCKNQQWT